MSEKNVSVWSKNPTQLKTNARKAVFEQAVAEHLSQFEMQENGELVLSLGTIEGRPVNLIVKASVSGRTDFAKKERKANAQQEEQVQPVVAELFD